MKPRSHSAHNIANHNKFSHNNVLNNISGKYVDFKKEEYSIMMTRVQALNEQMSEKCKQLSLKPLEKNFSFNFIFTGIYDYLKKIEDYDKKQRKDDLKKWWMNQKASEMAKDCLPTILDRMDSISSTIAKQERNELTRGKYEQYIRFELLECALKSNFRRPRASSANVFPNTSFQYARSRLRKKLENVYFNETELRNMKPSDKKKKEEWLKLIEHKKTKYKEEWMKDRLRQKKKKKKHGHHHHGHNSHNHHHHGHSKKNSKKKEKERMEYMQYAINKQKSTATTSSGATSTTIMSLSSSNHSNVSMPESICSSTGGSSDLPILEIMNNGNHNHHNHGHEKEDSNSPPIPGQNFGDISMQKKMRSTDIPPPPPEPQIQTIGNNLPPAVQDMPLISTKKPSGYCSQCTMYAIQLSELTKQIHQFKMSSAQIQMQLMSTKDEVKHWKTKYHEKCNELKIFQSQMAQVIKCMQSSSIISNNNNKNKNEPSLNEVPSLPTEPRSSSHQYPGLHKQSGVSSLSHSQQNVIPIDEINNHGFNPTMQTIHRMLSNTLSNSGGGGTRSRDNSAISAAETRPRHNSNEMSWKSSSVSVNAMSISNSSFNPYNFRTVESSIHGFPHLIQNNTVNTNTTDNSLGPLAQTHLKHDSNSTEEMLRRRQTENNTNTNANMDNMNMARTSNHIQTNSTVANNHRLSDEDAILMPISGDNHNGNNVNEKINGNNSTNNNFLNVPQSNNNISTPNTVGYSTSTNTSIKDDMSHNSSSNGTPSTFNQRIMAQNHQRPSMNNLLIENNSNSNNMNGHHHNSKPSHARNYNHIDFNNIYSNATNSNSYQTQNGNSNSYQTNKSNKGPKMNAFLSSSSGNGTGTNSNNLSLNSISNTNSNNNNISSALTNNVSNNLQILSEYWYENDLHKRQTNAVGDMTMSPRTLNKNNNSNNININNNIIGHNANDPSLLYQQQHQQINQPQFPLTHFSNQLNAIRKSSQTSQM